MNVQKKKTGELYQQKESREHVEVPNVDIDWEQYFDQNQLYIVHSLKSTANDFADLEKSQVEIDFKTITDDLQQVRTEHQNPDGSKYYLIDAPFVMAIGGSGSRHIKRTLPPTRLTIRKYKPTPCVNKQHSSHTRLCIGYDPKNYSIVILEAFFKSGSRVDVNSSNIAKALHEWNDIYEAVKPHIQHYKSKIDEQLNTSLADTIVEEVSKEENIKKMYQSYQNIEQSRIDDLVEQIQQGRKLLEDMRDSYFETYAFNVPIHKKVKKLDEKLSKLLKKDPEQSNKIISLEEKKKTKELEQLENQYNNIISTDVVDTLKNLSKLEQLSYVKEFNNTIEDLTLEYEILFQKEQSTMHEITEYKEILKTEIESIREQKRKLFERPIVEAKQSELIESKAPTMHKEEQPSHTADLQKLFLDAKTDIERGFSNLKQANIIAGKTNIAEIFELLVHNIDKIISDLDPQHASIQKLQALKEHAHAAHNKIMTAFINIRNMILLNMQKGKVLKFLNELSQEANAIDISHTTTTKPAESIKESIEQAYSTIEKTFNNLKGTPLIFAKGKILGSYEEILHVIEDLKTKISEDNKKTARLNTLSDKIYVMLMAHSRKFENIKKTALLGFQKGKVLKEIEQLLKEVEELSTELE